MLVKIFYEIDEFCKQFKKKFELNLLTNGMGKRKRAYKLSMSEIMSIAVYYHYSGFKTFKDYYEKHVLKNMQSEFNNRLVSYNRFLELRQKLIAPLAIFLQLNTRKASCTGISFIDSFPLKVCHTRRESLHKAFKGLAQKGKTSIGWFYGFKLHIIINQFGEITSFCITSGNVADNNEKVLTKITKRIAGKLFGDKGYLINESLFKKLYNNGVKLITKVRKNMKNKFMNIEDKINLKKRGIIESVGSVLKGTFSLEHTRHRSIFGFISHIITTIIAYNFKDKKPSITYKLNEHLKIA